MWRRLRFLNVRNTMNELKHYHTWERPIPKSPYFMCKDPHCTKKEKKEFLVGKAARCPKCDSIYTLTRIQLRYRLPKCDNCIETRLRREVKQEIQNITTDIINEILEPANIEE